MSRPLRRTRRTAVRLVPSMVGLALLGQGFLASSVGASTTWDGPSGVSAGSFTDSYAEMTHFRSLAHSGHGEVGILLPDSAVERSVGPKLTGALLEAGLRPRDIDVQDAGESDAAQFGAAERDIAHGARALILDPIDSGVGTQIEAYAQTKHVKTIDYDNVSLGGSRSYFVGFDEVAAGRELVHGLASCLSAWHVRHPRILVMSGPLNDATTTALTEGADEALRPLLRTHRWAEAAAPTGTGDPAWATAEFQAAHGDHPDANAALVFDDQADGAIVKDLQGAHVRPHVFPTTGYGATIEGLQNILRGYQCGTVYLPTAREAQAAAALALFVRAGSRPPTNLVNGSVVDSIAKIDVPAVLVSPQWVTSTNMASTVLAHGDVTASQLCAGSSADDCRAAGITP